MQSHELLQGMLQTSFQMTMALFEDLRTAPLVPATPGGNHAHWTAGHLTFVEGRLFSYAMRGLENPAADLEAAFGRGTSPKPNGEGYPPYDALLQRLVQMRGETMAWLATLTEEDFDRPSAHFPPGREAMFGTWRACCATQAMHWMTHRGQLADCRRAAGRAPLFA